MFIRCCQVIGSIAVRRWSFIPGLHLVRLQLLCWAYSSWVWLLSRPVLLHMSIALFILLLLYYISPIVAQLLECIYMMLLWRLKC